MPRISGSIHGDGIQAVLLAFKVLEHMALHRGSIGVTELAHTFETTKNRIHRHLQTLVESGYVVQDAGDDRYRLSARLMALGEAVGQNFDLSVAARPALIDLRKDLGHSVAISIPEAEGVRVVAVIRGGSNVEIGVKPGSLLPYHSSSQGKVALAYGDRELVERVVAHGLTADTPNSITAVGDLEAELVAIKRRGWATAANQTVLGLNALATPIFGALGQFVGTVSIVDSVQFIEDLPRPDQIDRVRWAALRISETLGFRDAP